MNPQIMSKLQSKIEADKAAYFAKGGKIQYCETMPAIDPADIFAPKDPEWVDTLTAAHILDVDKSYLRKLRNDHAKFGTPCPVTKLEGKRRLWKRASLKFFARARKS